MLLTVKAFLSWSDLGLVYASENHSYQRDAGLVAQRMGFAYCRPCPPRYVLLLTPALLALRTAIICVTLELVYLVPIVLPF